MRQLRTLVIQVRETSRFLYRIKDFETKKNLTLDIDAMNEVAWCYLEGFGCKKDKVGSIQGH